MAGKDITQIKIVKDGGGALQKPLKVTLEIKQLAFGHVLHLEDKTDLISFA